jgi:hypothetical protein
LLFHCFWTYSCNDAPVHGHTKFMNKHTLLQLHHVVLFLTCRGKKIANCGKIYTNIQRLTDQCKILFFVV